MERERQNIGGNVNSQPTMMMMMMTMTMTMMLMITNYYVDQLTSRHLAYCQTTTNYDTPPTHHVAHTHTVARRPIIIVAATAMAVQAMKTASTLAYHSLILLMRSSVYQS
jgi:hypothetical protein